jgi:hypothetical protein
MFDLSEAEEATLAADHRAGQHRRAKYDDCPECQGDDHEMVAAFERYLARKREEAHDA